VNSTNLLLFVAGGSVVFAMILVYLLKNLQSGKSGRGLELIHVPDAERQRVFIRFYPLPARQMLFFPRRSIRIGRPHKGEPVPDFVLFDSRVSRSHAEIVCEKGAYYLIDAGSKNGVFLNGNRVSSRIRLENEDIITILPYKLRFLDPKGAVAGELGDTSPFRFKGKLATGGMSVVYRAEDIRSRGARRDMAVKLPKEYKEDLAERRRRITEEAEITGLMDHPNIVKFVESGDLASGLPYLCVELVEGSSLRRRMNDLRSEGRTMTEVEARRIGAEIADALAVVHANQYVHCDIKPENVLLDPSNRVKLADFGIAWRIGRPGPNKWGAYHYMAPEHIAGQTPVPATDSYSLASTLYEMLCGVCPFEGSRTDVKRSHETHETIVAPRSRIPDISDDLNDILMRMLTPEPGQRLSDPKQISHLLRGRV